MCVRTVIVRQANIYLFKTAAVSFIASISQPVSYQLNIGKSSQPTAAMQRCIIMLQLAHYKAD